MKSEGLKELEQLMYDKKRKAYPNAPAYSISKVKYSDSSANGLTKCLIDFLTVNGHKAWRQSSEGRYRPGKTITDVIGRVRQMKGTFLPGQNNGAADVCAIIKSSPSQPGQFIAWEVKMNDRQSERQKQYQQEIEQSGGRYFITRSFEEFLTQYKQITKVWEV